VARLPIALATRIAKFDKWAVANTKRLVNTSLPPDVELGAGWDACITSLGRPAAQNGMKALMSLGFHKPGDVESRLADYLGQIERWPDGTAGLAPLAELGLRAPHSFVDCASPIHVRRPTGARAPTTALLAGSLLAPRVHPLASTQPALPPIGNALL
jgi:hypothetical protein